MDEFPQEALNRFKQKCESLFSQFKDAEAKEIEALRTAISNFEEQAKESINKHEESYSQLSNKVEGLLPGATSVGLAAAYAAEKNLHTWPYRIWSFVFILSIGGMVLLSKSFIKPSEGGDYILEDFFYKLIIYLPVVWLARFSSKQQSQHKRLAAEYAHKESLSKSYEGYNRAIVDLGASTQQNELRKKLMDAIIEASKVNPSDTLEKKSHNEKPPLSDAIENIAEKAT